MAIHYIPVNAWQSTWKHITTISDRKHTWLFLRIVLDSYSSKHSVSLIWSIGFMLRKSLAVQAVVISFECRKVECWVSSDRQKLQEKLCITARSSSQTFPLLQYMRAQNLETWKNIFYVYAHMYYILKSIHMHEI